MGAAFAHIGTKTITSRYNLDTFKRNSKECSRRFVTVDESWIYRFIRQKRMNSENSGLRKKNALQRANKNGTVGRKGYGH